MQNQEQLRETSEAIIQSLRKTLDEQTTQIRELKASLESLRICSNEMLKVIKEMEIENFKIMTGNQDPTYEELVQAGIYPRAEVDTSKDIPF